MHKVGLIGTGRAAAHLGQALVALGEPLVALGGRDVERTAALARRWGVAPCTPVEVLARADWVLLAVRDEAIAPVCAALPWAPRHVAIHLSGASPLSVLDAARAAGAQVAGFHPLQLLADPEPTAAAARSALAGICIGIEGEGEVAGALAALARRLGAQPLTLDGAQRAAYHAGANAAASGLLAPLALASHLCAEALGLSPDEALRALMPLAHGALKAASERGLAGALSGPVARGDVPVLQAHAQALAARSQPNDAALYAALVEALLPLAAQTGRLDAAALARLRGWRRKPRLKAASRAARPRSA
jgi:predicted short-subunit dehydrogenase-like oxidoreductase (DUF2520 family)